MSDEVKRARIDEEQAEAALIDWMQQLPPHLEAQLNSVELEHLEGPAGASWRIVAGLQAPSGWPEFPPAPLGIPVCPRWDPVAMSPGPRVREPRSLVLLADDDEGTLQSLRRFLEAEGYSALVADPARPYQDAIEIWMSMPELRLAIVDLAMPDAAGRNNLRTGFSLCAELKRRAGSRVAIHTGHSANSNLFEAFAQGADAFVRKDSPEQLRAITWFLSRMVQAFSRGTLEACGLDVSFQNHQVIQGDLTPLRRLLEEVRVGESTAAETLEVQDLHRDPYQEKPTLVMRLSGDRWAMNEAAASLDPVARPAHIRLSLVPVDVRWTSL